MNSPTRSRRSQYPPIPHQAIGAKIFHWINIISLVLMITSGLQIYNANPVFGGRGGWGKLNLLKSMQTRQECR